MIPFLHGALASGEVVPSDAYVLIASQTVGAGGAASITFSSIPSTYKHLQVRWLARQNPSNTYNDQGMHITFNGDTGANYTWHYLAGDGSAAASGGGGSGTAYGNWGLTTVDGTLANTFAAGVIDILDYTSTTKNKTFRHLNGYDLNGAGKISLFSGAWLNSSTAMTSISFVGVTGYNQYSRFDLYGIAG